MSQTYQKIQAIIFRKNSVSIEYLALKRTPQKKGIWQPVTGNKDNSDKDLLSCLQREIKEEIGIKSPKRIIENISSFSYLRKEEESEKKFEEHVFAVELDYKQTISLQQEPYREHEDYLWTSYDGVFELFEFAEQREALNKIHQILLKEF